MSHSTQEWSREVAEHSDTLDLDRDVFKKDDSAKIAASLKRSAEHGPMIEAVAQQQA